MKSAVKIVGVRVRTVGLSFGCVGQLVSGNNRVLAECDVRPHGCTAAASADAIALAARKGWTVRS